MRKTLATLLLVAAFTPAAMADDRGDIMGVDSAFSRMSMERGMAAAFSHYLASDAVKLDGGAHATLGHDAIMKGFEGLPADMQLEWWPQDGSVAGSGDLAYTWGTYELRFMKDGERKTAYGKYTTIWAKRDGEWKAVLDMGNASPGPAPQ
ncbi:YybH family protein [Gimibacter soli]|uniref:Nuclear transport factor 2 family protein n=1 Tax=Gimibacter soli TaxID=3024400 RepID=A0AAF0BJ48_9PROT|nr:nuclear transport factor 2 family protein [Gimibacter soli]WCL52679.1 nuclear transport factor 2 family protein [Gimibacter soli]